jgi:hypothetical protein
VCEKKVSNGSVGQRELGASGGAPSVLKTSDNSERLRKFEGHELAEDILPRVSGKKSAESDAARRSIHSATDGDTAWYNDGSPWCDDGSSSNGTCDDRAGCADAAGPNDTASADDGVGFHSAQGDECSNQQ